jgi:adenine-specific DNA methylase
MIMMNDTPRLIEHAFPLKQASLDSVHEKNVRHGHISTLHIWPARRPLAACRAALIATLLPDPSASPKPEGMSDAQWEEEVIRQRKALCEKIGGKVVKKIERKKMPNGQIVERIKEETEGGILHWGRETENADTLEWFRQEIRKAYGGRAPRVLDPFAGGGAIPLEAMRLGCEATAVDINPVAWFILKCTLEYPHRLAGQMRPLPEFILHDDAFMRGFFAKAKSYGKAETTAAIKRLHEGLNKHVVADPHDVQGGLPFAVAGHTEGRELQADLAWHVRAWGQWVLARARRELSQYYPTYADYEPIIKGEKAYEYQPMRIVPVSEDGTANIDTLNTEFSRDYLADRRNPRWVAKPTVAYLWARTVKCKNCRATVPLLKTRWLCRKPNKRVLLTMEPNADRTSVTFGVEANVPIRGGNAAQKREHDRRTGAGTLTQSGARCPCCPVIMTMDDIQVVAQAHEWRIELCAVIVDGQQGKEYRSATEGELNSVGSLVATHPLLQTDPLDEPIDPIRPSPNARGLSGLTRYGITRFADVYSPRQQMSLATLCEHVAAVRPSTTGDPWVATVSDLLALAVDHVANRNSTLCHWDVGRETISSTFQRYALRVNWDFVEGSPVAEGSGSLASAVDWIALVIEHAERTTSRSVAPTIALGSATQLEVSGDRLIDLVLTDPPYYDAIPYGDLSDFFYVWMRRAVGEHHGPVFEKKLADKSEELIQHAARTGGDNHAAKRRYEDGMAQSFVAVRKCLQDNGRLVVVFANKQPDAWETLASSIVRAGFSVDASWPIETEMPNKAAGGARLASSVWLVCKKRPPNAKPGWDNSVLAEMRKNIAVQLREFWDAGIRGPDFVWAATGPAMEAYSKHPIVKKADSPDEIMTVSEFLTHVRRMVVDFVVGRVLSGDGEATDQAATDRLDEPTAYYLLHRHDFGMEDAPAGTCILYAVSCGLSDKELVDTWDLLAHTGGAGAGASSESGDDEEDEADADDASEGNESSGSKLRLRTWAQRKAKSMGYEAPGGKPVPLIDRIHRLMHLWKAQDVHKVDEYLDDNALRRHELFKRLLQSLIELSPGGSDERSLLESLSNHVGAKGAKRDKGPDLFEKLAAGENEGGQ